MSHRTFSFIETLGITMCLGPFKYLRRNVPDAPLQSSVVFTDHYQPFPAFSIHWSFPVLLQLQLDWTSSINTQKKNSRQTRRATTRQIPLCDGLRFF